MNTFDKHQIAIAKRTLRMSDVGVLVMGGMDKPTARQVLRDLAGWSGRKIELYEGEPIQADDPIYDYS